MSEPRPLIDQFLSYAEASINEDGIWPAPMLTAGDDAAGAAITLHALAIDPGQAVALAIAKTRNEAAVILGLDRFTVPGQGIELPDFLSVYWWRRAAGWRFGVLAYRHQPRLVAPIDWDNAFWTARMTREIELLTGAAPQLAS